MLKGKKSKKGGKSLKDDDDAEDSLAQLRKQMKQQDEMAAAFSQVKYSGPSQDLSQVNLSEDSNEICTAQLIGEKCNCPIGTTMYLR